MAPHDLRRPFKRPAISDQQRRRELSLQRQSQNRLDAQQQARCLASSVLSLQSQYPDPVPELEIEPESQPQQEAGPLTKDLDIRQASKLRGPEVRKWFASQLMLPEWMIDVPDRLSHDWYVFARPAGKRCIVVSSNGTTVSRERNGSILHHFPSALPSGARTKDPSGFFWLNSKLAETGACDAPSHYHKFRFSTVPVYDCDQRGLYSAYIESVPYAKDGLLFYNKHAHYQTGNTPLALVWKDEKCSQYVIDTDSKGQVLSQQQVVLELQEDGKLSTSDDPPVIFGCLDGEFIQKSGLQSGSLLKFAIGNGGLSFVDGKLEKSDLNYLGKSNRARMFADSYSKTDFGFMSPAEMLRESICPCELYVSICLDKVIFQYMVRHTPLKFDDLLASVSPSDDEENKPCDVEMVD
ncbi:hypothetical protein WN944_013414 [Citrus x changshan-huyou]|uniref:Snurportin-1 n=1 Tax=Citrus x changshan-huyou TaxID=2935761 RepID=A0AAP0QKQ1_9ROSI